LIRSAGCSAAYPAVKLPIGPLGPHGSQFVLALDDPLGEQRGDPVQEQDPLRLSGQLSLAQLQFGSRFRQFGLCARETVVERIDLTVLRTKRCLDIVAAIAEQRSLEQRLDSLRLLPARGRCSKPEPSRIRCG
jgi:hypothetical protein